MIGWRGQAFTLISSEALAHYRALLDLSPGDHQGARYLLPVALLELGLNEQAGVLLWRELAIHHAPIPFRAGYFVSCGVGGD